MLTSQQLQYEGLVPMKVYSKQDKDGRSSQSSVSSSESLLLGDLEVGGKKIFKQICLLDQARFVALKRRRGDGKKGL